MPIMWPTGTKDVIDEIREAVGRGVTFIIRHEEDCPVCSIDPVTGNSTNPFCATCSGLGYIPTYSGYNLTAHITWGQADIMSWISAGQYVEGDCRIQIEYTPEHVTVVDTAHRVIVDGKYLKVKKRILRGVDSINRIILDLEEEEI
jgi:hypothetical protein